MTRIPSFAEVDLGDPTPTDTAPLVSWSDPCAICAAPSQLAAIDFERRSMTPPAL